MQPFPYQEKNLTEIIDKFRTKQRICYQLMTSGGKTAVFSFLIKWYIGLFPKKVLILAHREELITQAEGALNECGVGSEIVLSKHKKLKHHSDVYVSMIETAYNRLKKNPYFFQNIGLVICDEAHILVYQKVFEYFPNAKILGCTATPVILKRETFYKCKYCRSNHVEETECCNEVTEEWTRPVTLSSIYEDIVIGPTPDELIEFGSIVREVSFKKHYTDDSKLRTDSDGEFIPETVEKEYGSDNAVFNVLLNYEELCAGKKTLIFNSSAKTNLAVYNKFIEAGYENVRMYDSVNTEQSGSRSDLLNWFAETQDAVLLNVGVFTTGFNSREVEAILINRPIGSLGLFIQIGGRGCRSSIKIYKQNYILVDGGGNIDRFGEISDERDWRKIFFEGNGKERSKKLNAIDIHDCPECGCLYPKHEIECPACGYQIPEPKSRKREAVESDEIMQPIRAIPPPNGEKIYQYTLSKEEDINFAFKIMIGQLIDMFRYYRISYDQYISALESGELDKKTSDLIRKCYFVLLNKPDIQTPGKRTLKNLLDRTKEQLKKYYEDRRKPHPTRVFNMGTKHLLPETSPSEVCNF